MKKSVFSVILTLFLLCAVVMVYRQLPRTESITINGQTYRQDIAQISLSAFSRDDLVPLLSLPNLKTLDLREAELTPQEYDHLRWLLPDCRILWQIPFQGQRYTVDTDALRVTQLTVEDLALLDYFPALTSVDASGCGDLEAVLALKARYPELAVTYTVAVCGQTLPNDVRDVVFADADGAQVLAALPYLPQLQSVTFIGTAPDNEIIGQMRQLFPGIVFTWEFEVLGVQTGSNATELILSGIPMDSVAQVEESLQYFNCLERVEMCDCGISSEQMDALQQRHPEIRFVWTIRIGWGSLRTDATAFVAYSLGYNSENRLYDRDCTELKYCIDMVCLDLGHMGITDYSFLESMPKLKYLILADTRGSDFSALGGLKELVFLELFMTNFSQPEVLAGCTALEDLNISVTAVTDWEPLMEMTHLQRLWTLSNDITDQEKDALVQALPNTMITFRAEHSTAGGWRESPNYYAMRDMLGMPYSID